MKLLYCTTAVLLALALMQACKNRPGGETAASGADAMETLAFEGREFFRQSPSCEADTNRCARVSARYPMAVAGPPEAVRRINDTLDTYVRLSLAVFALSPEEMPETLDEIAADFIREYEAVTTEEADFVTPWSAELEGRVLYQSEEAVSVQLSTFSFAGGAHPNYFTFLFTFDPATGRRLSLADVIRDTLGLRPLAEEGFREARELGAGESLQETGFFWGEDFLFPENWAVTAEGLYFFYNPYEVAAYVMGPTEFTIPRERLPGLLK